MTDIRIYFLKCNYPCLVVPFKLYVQYKPLQCFKKEKLSGLKCLGTYLLLPSVSHLQLRTYVNKKACQFDCLLDGFKFSVIQSQSYIKKKTNYAIIKNIYWSWALSHLVLWRVFPYIINLKYKINYNYYNYSTNNWIHTVTQIWFKNKFYLLI